MLCSDEGKYLAVLLVIFRSAPAASIRSELKSFPLSNGVHLFHPYYYTGYDKRSPSRISKRQLSEYGVGGFRAYQNRPKSGRRKGRKKLSYQGPPPPFDGYAPENIIPREAGGYADMQNQASNYVPQQPCCPCAPQTVVSPPQSYTNTAPLPAPLSIPVINLPPPLPNYDSTSAIVYHNDPNILRYNNSGLNNDETRSRIELSAYPPKALNLQLAAPVPEPPAGAVNAHAGMQGYSTNALNPYQPGVPAQSTPQAPPRQYNLQVYHPGPPILVNSYPHPVVTANRQPPPYFTPQSHVVPPVPVNPPPQYAAQPPPYGVYGYGIPPHSPSELCYAEDGTSIPCGYQLPPAGGYAYGPRSTSTAAPSSTGGSTAVTSSPDPTSTATGSTVSSGSTAGTNTTTLSSSTEPGSPTEPSSTSSSTSSGNDSSSTGSPPRPCAVIGTDLEQSVRCY